METSKQFKPIPRISGSPLIGNLSEFRASRLDLLLRVSRECGEIGSFRIGPLSVVVVSSATLANSILVGHAEDFNAGAIGRLFVPLVGDKSLILQDGAPHREQRRLLAPTFHPKRLAEFSQCMVRYAQETLAGWKEGQLLDVNQEMTLLTMRIIGKTLFDVDFLNEASDLREAMMLSIAHFDHMSASMPIPLSWPTARNRRAREALAILDNNIQTMIDERRGDPADRKDLLSTLLQVRDDAGQPISAEQIRSHIATFFSAGHETTAVALSWLWQHLARHPEVYARVKQEVDAATGGRPPGYEDLPRLGYLQQVIKESLRLTPPIFMLARTAVRDVEIEGYRLRKGQMVLMPPYCIHRNPEYFPDPERFLPERFEPEREKSRPKHSYMPFGFGPHTCIGSYFAMMEIQLIMATMIQQVDFELPEGQHIKPEVLTVTLRPSPYEMRVKHRNRPINTAVA
uniref:Cytochrome P450 n=1 Tax=Vitiosangium cumulatum TaxID=1867796 RepID=A0A7D5BEC0_9BACT|nr:hypothetical protein [Vitiosangium cumulatum]